MAKILIVEDQRDNFLLIRHAIGDTHDILWATSLASARHALDERVDLILVDIGLPDGDGFEFCQWVRSHDEFKRIPIIFVTGKNSLESRVTGYSIGGDDYISKPFSPVELKARIEAKLRIAKTESSPIITYRGVRVDTRAQRAQALIGETYRDLDLTPIELRMLVLLIEEGHRVLSRDEILNKIWGKDVFVFPRSVDTHISKLRKKLGQHEDIIRSVHGLGYRLNEQALVDNEPTPHRSIV